MFEFSLTVRDMSPEMMQTANEVSPQWSQGPSPRQAGAHLTSRFPRKPSLELERWIHSSLGEQLVSHFSYSPHTLHHTNLWSLPGTLESKAEPQLQFLRVQVVGEKSPNHPGPLLPPPPQNYLHPWPTSCVPVQCSTSPRRHWCQDCSSHCSKHCTWPPELTAT